MILLLLSISVVGAKVMHFSDTPLSCHSISCPDGSSCMEMPEGAFCWPVFVTTTRPPKPSCASIRCASDEQCVNAFDGPTCRRVTFDLSDKWITTTTPSSWSPEPVEAPQTVSVFVEREESRPTFRSFPPSPPAPPSVFLHAMHAKEIEDMPPTSFRKPSVPMDCDKVHCPVGQSCFMKEVKCFTEICSPVPYCR